MRPQRRELLSKVMAIDSFRPNPDSVTDTRAPGEPEEFDIVIDALAADTRSLVAIGAGTVAVGVIANVAVAVGNSGAAVAFGVESSAIGVANSTGASS